MVHVLQLDVKAYLGSQLSAGPMEGGFCFAPPLDLGPLGYPPPSVFCPLACPLVRVRAARHAARGARALFGPLGPRPRGRGGGLIDVQRTTRKAHASHCCRLRSAATTTTILTF
jgi:hypothetical protein